MFKQNNDFIKSCNYLIGQWQITNIFAIYHDGKLAELNFTRYITRFIAKLIPKFVFHLIPDANHNREFSFVSKLNLFISQHNLFHYYIQLQKKSHKV